MVPHRRQGPPRIAHPQCAPGEGGHSPPQRATPPAAWSPALCCKAGCHSLCQACAGFMDQGGVRVAAVSRFSPAMCILPAQRRNPASSPAEGKDAAEGSSHPLRQRSQRRWIVAREGVPAGVPDAVCRAAGVSLGAWCLGPLHKCRPTATKLGPLCPVMPVLLFSVHPLWDHSHPTCAQENPQRGR